MPLVVWQVFSPNHVSADDSAAPETWGRRREDPDFGEKPSQDTSLLRANSDANVNHGEQISAG